MLVAEVQGISGDSEAILESVVIETNKDNRGPLVSLVVKNGTLKVGSWVYAEGTAAKVRGIFDASGMSVKQVLPGYPALVLGFETLPEVGSVVSGNKEKVGIQVKAEKKNSSRSESELTIILKAKSAGSLEALIANIPENVEVLTGSVGEVNESDVMLAKDAGSLIFVFESKVANQVKKLADNDGIKIYEFDIIYKLVDKLKEITESAHEKVLGKANILQSFPFNDKQVAGCKVKNGTIARNKVLVIERDDKELGRVKIISLKKQKDDVQSVSQGEEFGVIFVPQLDFRVGDMLVSVEN